MTIRLPVTALSFLGCISVPMLWCESLSSLYSVSASGAQGRCRSRLPREHLLLLGHTVNLAEGLTKRLPQVKHKYRQWELKDAADHSDMTKHFVLNIYSRGKNTHYVQFRCWAWKWSDTFHSLSFPYKTLVYLHDFLNARCHSASL